MKKLIILIICLIPLSVNAELYSDKAIVYDITDDIIIYEKNSEVETSIASLTKILTVMTALNNISDINENITITSEMLNNIYWDASVAGLKIGDTVTYLDLMYATILPSGADAAQVLAINTGGSIDNFVLMMNNLADRIGMTNSNFINSTGLDANNQYSTVKDVLTLLKYALDNPTFKKVFMTREYVLENELKVRSTLYSYNKNLNLDISRILGSKTGRTGDAGLCLASLISFKKHDVLIITVGAPDKNGYNLVDNLNIINYLDNNYVIPFKIEGVNEDLIVEAFKKANNSYHSDNYFFIGIISIIVILGILVIIKPKKTFN
ncbi:MAG: D-alanyl-D-alanine carboxypeptidase [Ruminococcus sp.]|nr:D-alanyl-D-alanine carboxypeptidase [Ruminococcus sp.]